MNNKNQIGGLKKLKIQLLIYKSKLTLTDFPCSNLTYFFDFSLLFECFMAVTE